MCINFSNILVTYPAVSQDGFQCGFIFTITSNTKSLKQGSFDYLHSRKAKIFADNRQRITYSYNNVENTIVGYVEENGDLICLYEYRGQYFGTEFLISFSRNSASYKLINAESEERLPN